MTQPAHETRMHTDPGPEERDGDDASPPTTDQAGGRESDASISLRPAEELLGHERFPEVRSRQIARALALYDIQRFPGGFVVDPWRVILLGQIMGMAAENAGGLSFATPTALKQRMKAYGLYSPRQIDAYLSRLVQTGDLDVTVYPDDRRMRLLRPLPPLLEWYWSFLELYHSGYRTLFPEPGVSSIERRDAGFLPFMARIGADKQTMAISIELMTREPGLAAFLSRSGGTLLLQAALDLQLREPERVLRESDLLAYGSRFGCSRSHVRNLIALAIETSFFEEIGRRRQNLRPTERLVSVMNRYIADTIRASERTNRLAEREYRNARRPVLLA